MRVKASYWQPHDQVMANKPIFEQLLEIKKISATFQRWSTIQIQQNNVSWNKMQPEEFSGTFLSSPQFQSRSNKSWNNDERVFGSQTLFSQSGSQPCFILVFKNVKLGETFWKVKALSRIYYGSVNWSNFGLELPRLQEFTYSTKIELILLNFRWHAVFVPGYCNIYYCCKNPWDCAWKILASSLYLLHAVNREIEIAIVMFQQGWH